MPAALVEAVGTSQRTETVRELVRPSAWTAHTTWSSYPAIQRCATDKVSRASWATRGGSRFRHGCVVERLTTKRRKAQRGVVAPPVAALLGHEPFEREALKQATGGPDAYLETGRELRGR